MNYNIVSGKLSIHGGGDEIGWDEIQRPRRETAVEIWFHM